MDIQRLTVMGRVTRDAEIISGKSSKDFAVFGVAANRPAGKDKPYVASFYDVMCFGTEAYLTKIIEKVKKGDSIFVEGRPELDVYVSGKDKEAKAQIKIIADICNVQNK